MTSAYCTMQPILHTRTHARTHARTHQSSCMDRRSYFSSIQLRSICALTCDWRIYTRPMSLFTLQILCQRHHTYGRWLRHFSHVIVRKYQKNLRYDAGSWVIVILCVLCVDILPLLTAVSDMSTDSAQNTSVSRYLTATTWDWAETCAAADGPTPVTRGRMDRCMRSDLASAAMAESPARSSVTQMPTRTISWTGLPDLGTVFSIFCFYACAIYIIK